MTKKIEKLNLKDSCKDSEDKIGACNICIAFKIVRHRLYRDLQLLLVLNQFFQSRKAKSNYLNQIRFTNS